MMKHIGLMGLTAAAVTAMFIACSDGGGGTDITCSGDTDCRVGEICHPDAKVCVQTCTSGADCPDSSKNCDFLNSTGGADGGTGSGTKICKCVTTTLCQGGTAGADSVCQDEYDVCTPPCTADTDCAVGDTCDTGTGQCKPGTGTDGGTDGGMATSCTWQTAETACPGNEVCNIQQGQCGAAVSCTGEGQASCSYGSECEGGSCAPVPHPTASGTCSPFMNNNVTWNPTSDMGPVIYSVENITDDPSKCQMGTAQTIRLKAYGTTAFPTDKNQLNGFNYVNQSGAKTSIPPNFLQQSNYQGGGTNNITATFTLCNTQTSGAFSAGFEFAGGNQFCFLVQ